MNQKDKEGLIIGISELIGALTQKEKQEIAHRLLGIQRKGMPISVFKANLSSLAIVIKYLKEVENKPFNEISKILNRKLSTLYTTYTKSKIKFKRGLDLSDNSIVIPCEIFANRKYSVLESIAAYLKDKQNLSFMQISSLLNKNYSTIRTVYRRYRMKK